MGRLIIHYEDVPVEDVLVYVQAVVRKGRISNNDTQYCYFVMFNNHAEVYTSRTANGTDVFTVRRPKEDKEATDD